VAAQGLEEMKTPGLDETKELYEGNGREQSSGGAQALSLSEAENVLLELASVFFPADAAAQQSSGGLIEKQRGSTIRAAELPNAVARYRTLIEQIPAVVFMAFLDRGIGEAYVSPQIEAMLGFTQEEWLNDPVRWYQHIHPDDKERWSIEAAQMFLSGEPLKSVYRVLARDRRVIWFHCEAKMVRRDDGWPWFIHGVAFDITELKQAEESLRQARDELEMRVEHRTAELESANQELRRARDELEIRVAQRTAQLAQANEVLLEEIGERRRTEEALRKSEGMLRGLFEFAPDTVVVVDRAGRIARVNAQIVAMFGYSQDELLSKPVELLLPDRFRQGHMRHRADYTAEPHTRTMGAGLELQGRRKDGSEFPVDIMLSPIDTKEGHLVIAVVRDITRRKQAEEAQREHGERMKILSRRLMEVQESERRSIARELHDEIGQALTGLKLTLEMGARLPPEQVSEYFGRALAVVNEIMARARKLSLDLRPGMLDDLGLLPAVLWHIEHYTAQTGVRVDFKHTGLEGRRFTPEIETAAYRIVQEALTNVARHAVVSEAAVRLWADNNRLALQIEDQGAGFDTESVFAARDTSGLAGMRERAMLLGGQLTVESRPGIGTRLTAELKTRVRGQGSGVSSG
jgi:PAS domain S-box-containing protein